MAMESRIRLLPIPCCSRQHRPVVHLQASPPSTMAKRSGSPQSNREKEVGEIYASLRQMDPNAPHPASLSRGSLLRHSSFVRAVCVDALARICAGCALKAHGIQSPEMGTAAKPSSQPRTESCVMSGNVHCEA